METLYYATLYWIEVQFIKMIRFFGINGDESKIPNGFYCYDYDEKRNTEDPCDEGYWIKTCKYFRSIKGRGGVACTYIPYYGFDFCLYDQCKICGENKET